MLDAKVVDSVTSFLEESKKFVEAVFLRQITLSIKSNCLIIYKV